MTPAERKAVPWADKLPTIVYPAPDPTGTGICYCPKCRQRRAEQWAKRAGR